MKTTSKLKLNKDKNEEIIKYKQKRKEKKNKNNHYVNMILYKIRYSKISKNVPNNSMDDSHPKSLSKNSPVLFDLI